MAAKAALLRVLVACLACAAAERNTLHIVTHTAQSNDTDVDEGLSYGGLDEWHSKALGKIDAFTSSVGAELESATAGALSESEKYAQMMHGLEGGFETFKSSVGSFRSANIHAQGTSNEEVRQVLQSARRTAMEDQATEAKASVSAETARYWQDQAKAETESEETAEVRDEGEVKQAENLTSSNVSVPPSVPGDKNLEPEEEEETSGLKPLFEEDEEGASHKADNLISSDVSVPPSVAGAKNLEPEQDGDRDVSEPPSVPGDKNIEPEEEEETSGLKPLFEEDEEGEASHKADNLTSSAVSVPPSVAGAKNLEPEEEEEETSGLKPLFEEDEEASHKADNLTSSNVSVDIAEADVRTQKKEEEEDQQDEEEDQKNLILACFALADSPLKGEDRRCDSEAVTGMFEGKPCEGHEGKYFTPEAACGASDKCEAKHVCLKSEDTDGDEAVVEAADGSWQVNDDAKCAEGSAAVVCVPRSGGYRLPPGIEDAE